MMRRWRDMLIGPLLWTGHYFTLYGIGEFGDGGWLSRISIGAFTLIILAILAQLWRRLRPRSEEDNIDRWQLHLTKLLVLLSALAVLWQTMPALLSY